MNIFGRFFNWVSGRNKYLVQIDKQMKLIEELKKKDFVTFLQPVNPDESDQYASFLCTVWNNRFFKWFLHDLERAVLIKFKSGTNADFIRGQLNLIEILASRMTEIRNDYVIKSKANENG